MRLPREYDKYKKIFKENIDKYSYHEKLLKITLSFLLGINKEKKMTIEKF